MVISLLRLPGHQLDGNTGPCGGGFNGSIVALQPNLAATAPQKLRKNCLTDFLCILD
jgi:hypothetical protein